MAISKELKRFFEELLLRLAEQDLLDLNRTVEEVVNERFDCPTPKVRKQIIAKVQKWRDNGKVNWKERIEE